MKENKIRKGMLHMRLYIIRHAEPDYENHTITPAGHLEAKALSNLMAKEGISHIYSSPMGRAMHTMQYTAEATGIEPVVVPWMAELGDWRVKDASGEETVVWNVHGEVVRGNRPFYTNDDWHRRPPYENYEFGTKFDAIKENSDRLFEAHGYKRVDGKYEIVRENRDRIAVFCHMGFGLAWFAHLMEMPLPLVWSGFWLAPSSVTTMLWDERSNRWAVPRCLGVGDVSHLHRSGISVSQMGIVANFE
jgi:broad specificity phosphatase PhoE